MPATATAAELSLGSIAASRGLLFGASFASHELDAPYGKDYARIYASDCRIITSELELKFGTLRPARDLVDYSGAERLLAFAEAHRMAVRGHTLIWNDNLPAWVKTLSTSECATLMGAHIDMVLARYRERIKIWDVVNEPIGPWDHNEGNLRGGPFYAALGPGYIADAFRRARAAAPHATLVLNEAQTETNDDNGQVFRTSLLALLKQLKDKGVPVDAVGIQSHLKLTARYDFPKFAAFLADIASLGYDLHITELDVNDTGLNATARERDRRVAAMYKAFLGEVLQLPAVRIVELWQMSDRTSWLRDPGIAQALKIRTPARPLIYDDAFRRKASWQAVADALRRAPKR